MAMSLWPHFFTNPLVLHSCTWAIHIEIFRLVDGRSLLCKYFVTVMQRKHDNKTTLSYKVTRIQYKLIH